jgi:hypothetical protein
VLTSVADLVTWAWRGDLDPALAFAVAVTVVGETHGSRGARPIAMMTIDDPLSTSRALADVLGARAAEAETRIRRLTREHGCEAVVRDVFAVALAPDLTSMGDAAAQTVRAWELARRFESIAEDIMAATAVMLATTFHCVHAGGGFDPVHVLSTTTRSDHSNFAHAARSSEHDAVVYAFSASARGATPQYLIAEAAAYVSGCARHLTTHAATVTDIARTLRLLDAASSLVTVLDRADALKVAAQCAGAAARIPYAHIAHEEVAAGRTSLDAALAARDVAGARAAMQALIADGHTEGFRRIAPFVASRAAARASHIALAVETVASLRALADRDAGRGHVHLDAALALTVPWRPERDIEGVVADVHTSHATDGE